MNYYLKRPGEGWMGCTYSVYAAALRTIKRSRLFDVEGWGVANWIGF